MENKKLISVVLPSYREEKNVPLVYAELIKNLEKISEKYDFEIIFVNDGSPDDTWEEILKLCEKDKRVKGVNLSRNFGKEIALTAGVEFAMGDAVITTDADGQRPAKMILQFIEEWEKGVKIIYGVRKQMNRGYFRKKASNVFNRMMTKISTISFQSGVTDFMLLDRRVVDYLKQYNGKNRIFRGVVLSLGFSQKPVYFIEPDRLNGDTQWNISNLFKLAIDSITSFSIFPLKLVGYLGIFISFFSTILLIFMIFSRFVFENPYKITNSVFFIIFNLMLSGITLSALGIMAIYIAKIHDEVIGRPMYLIQDKINFKK